MFSFLTPGLTLVSVVAVWIAPFEAPYRSVDALALVLAAAAPLSLFLCRVAPLAALAATGVVVVVNAAAGFDIGFIQWPPWIAVFACFAVAGLRIRVAAIAIVVLAVAGYLIFDRGEVTGELVTGMVMCALIGAIAGDATRTRRAYARAVQDDLLRAHREQALVAERLLLEERSRLARELHDSLGHSMNVMVLQAGVGRRLFVENPRFAREALSSVETVGRGALEELDRMLRVLHPIEPGTSEEPLAPTLADLEALADRVRATGREVGVRSDRVDDLRLAPGGARALYRIVQEALTNAVRHTTAGQISVDIVQLANGIVVEVGNALEPGHEENSLHRPVPGRGLINMRERARLEGGEFEAGPVEGRFRVRATIPAVPTSGVSA